jgi:hypothetical protein
VTLTLHKWLLRQYFSNSNEKKRSRQRRSKENNPVVQPEGGTTGDRLHSGCRFFCGRAPSPDGGAPIREPVFSLPGKGESRDKVGTNFRAKEKGLKQLSPKSLLLLVRPARFELATSRFVVLFLRFPIVTFYHIKPLTLKAFIVILFHKT